MESTCIYCQKSLPKDININFCPFCLKQINCLNCNENLLSGAIGCIKCGTPIIQQENNISLNQIEFEQKGDTKKFKATFSDNVGENLVATFGGMVGVQIPKKKISLLTSTNNSSSIVNASVIDIEAEESFDDDDIKEALLKIFKIDGDNLIFQTSKYKEKSKIEKEIRMSLLTLLGYKHIHNTSEIKRQTLTDILRKSKLGTANFRNWISKCEEIVTSSGNIISLTPDGLDKAHKVLIEVLDNNIITGDIAFSKNGTTARKKSSKSDTSTTSVRSSKSPKQYLLKLIDDGFFKENKILSDIINHLKNNYAVTYKSSDISGIMSNFTNNGTLKRSKTAKGYEYYI